MKDFAVVAFIALCIGSASSIAQEQHVCSGPQLGTWKLLSYRTEDLETGRKTDLFGAHPSGFISYGPDCRMYAILLKESRTAPKDLVATDAERIELFGGLISYAGTYTVDGEKISHHIDASWNQSWTGTTQVRQFKVEEKSLYIKTMPARNSITGKQSSSTLVWMKVE